MYLDLVYWSDNRTLDAQSLSPHGLRSFFRRMGPDFCIRCLQSWLNWQFDVIPPTQLLNCNLWQYTGSDLTIRARVLFASTLGCQVLILKLAAIGADVVALMEAVDRPN